MEANPVRIIQYFDGEKQSIIPLFQRPYTWNKRNWETLWEDIMAYYEDDDYSSSHFMGALVSILAKTVFANISSRLPADSEHVDEWLGAELANRIRSERWPDTAS